MEEDVNAVGGDEDGATRFGTVAVLLRACPGAMTGGVVCVEGPPVVFGVERPMACSYAEVMV